MTEELRQQIDTTMQNLRRNNMEAYFCETSAEARELVKTLLKPGDVISCGGSVTLKQTGVYDLIRSSEYRFLDRSREGITRGEVEEVYRKTFSADVFCTSTNALTENGELYNVDGNSNRVAAILYGPKSVIVVCGVNKLVKNIGEAVTRVKNKENPELCEGCHSEGRICCNYVVSAQQRHINRIKVIIINEELGY